MRRAEVWAVGKLRETGLRVLCDDYYRRCGRTLRLSEREFKDTGSLWQAVPKKSHLVLLDERGEHPSSEAFSQRLRRWLGGQASSLLFAIGGADGFTAEQRDRADDLLALSKMTLAHQLARLVLAEQLYRAVSIIEGSPYHRGG